MIRIRPYKTADSDEVLSWCQDETTFYRWTAGVLGNYPVTQKEFGFVESLMPFIAFDESGTVGFFTLRNPDESFDELRFGFVIVKPDKRGKGYGKMMLQQGLKFVFELYGARRASLGVFEENLAAYGCYKTVGFRDVVPDVTETYCIQGEEWKCKEMIIENEQCKNYQIRPITEADDPFIADIIRTNLKRYHLDIPGTVYYDPEVDHLSRYYHALPDKRGYFIVEGDDGQVIGGVGIAEFAGFENCAELQKIYLTDAVKGNGIGRHLMQVAEEFARKAGYDRMYLETHTNLETAIHMYEKLGFCQIGRPETVLHGTMNRFYLKEFDSE